MRNKKKFVVLFLLFVFCSIVQAEEKIMYVAGAKNSTEVSNKVVINKQRKSKNSTNDFYSSELKKNKMKDNLSSNTNRRKNRKKYKEWFEEGVGSEKINAESFYSTWL